MGKVSYKFELTAHSYSSANGVYYKPFSITLEEGNPRLGEFMGNRSFKQTRVGGPAPVAVTAPKSATPSFDDDATSLSDPDVVEALELEPKLIQDVIDAGFPTIESIEVGGSNKLKEISGIGKATAAKIVEAIEEYREEHPVPDDDD